METTHNIEFGNGCRICEAWLLSDKNWNPDNLEKIKSTPEIHRIVAKTSIPAGASLNEIFAINIQDSQLRDVIPQSEWNDTRLEEERSYFLWWLNNKGYKFQDQLSAWEAYKREHEFFEIDEDDSEEFTPSWLEEIENTINQAVRIANYSEYGGQL